MSLQPTIRQLMIQQPTTMEHHPLHRRFAPRRNLTVNSHPVVCKRMHHVAHKRMLSRCRTFKRSATRVIQLDQAGNLVLSSADTAALDQLENLMLQFAPPKRPYHVFKLQYASASWVKLNLQDYYKDSKEKDSKSDDFFRWYWGDGEEEKEEDPAGLGKCVTLRFVDDMDTNTIVVNGADREQLRTIAELIRLWDVAPPVDRRKTRFTKLVQVRIRQSTH